MQVKAVHLASSFHAYMGPVTFSLVHSQGIPIQIIFGQESNVGFSLRKENVRARSASRKQKRLLMPEK